MVLWYITCGTVLVVLFTLWYVKEIKRKRDEIDRHMLMDLIRADERPIRREYKKLRRVGIKPEKAMRYAFKVFGVEER